MKRQLGQLLIASAGIWIAVAYPCRWIWGDPTVLVHSGVAMVLCLVPTSLTLLWAGWANRQSPEHQLAMVLGGTGLRMLAVLGGALAIYLLVPYFQQPTFWVWVIVFYLVTLALEIVLIVAGQGQQAPVAGKE